MDRGEKRGFPALGFRSSGVEDEYNLVDVPLKSSRPTFIELELTKQKISPVDRCVEALVVNGVRSPVTLSMETLRKAESSDPSN